MYIRRANKQLPIYNIYNDYDYLNNVIKFIIFLFMK